MAAMGKHSPPLDGTVTANGHALAPFTIPSHWKTHGPLAALPRQQDTPGRWHPDGDTVIRVLASVVVLAVAAFAAIVSYSHIFELGRAHGQDGTAARLLPLSVDGLIAAASLVMLHAARRKLAVPQLARWMLGLGVGATVAANVEYGMPFGWLSAVVSAWPAVAFVGSVEMAVRFVRDARQDSAAGLPTVTPAAVTPPVTPARDKPPARPGPARRPPAEATKFARAAAVIRDNPDMTDNKALARLAGCDVRTVQRARNGTAKTP